jgi:hypothetical protein
VKSDNKIEIRSSTLEPLSIFYEDWSWADNLINAFYRMVNSKWNVWPSFPGVQKLEGPHDLVTDAAQVKFDSDFRSKYSHGSFPPIIYSDDDKGNDAVEENRVHLPGTDAEWEKRLPEIYFQLIIQGLPPTEAGDEVTPTAQYQKRGPTLKTLERAKAYKEIKDHNLTLSYYQVAIKANEELGGDITKETVRNVYRAMHWKWKRGNRGW